MNDAPPLPSSASTKPRRPLWRKVCLSLFLLGTLVLVVLYVVYSRDEPMPDVSDIAIHPLQLPDEQNAYAQLVKAAAMLPDYTLYPESADYRLDELVKNPPANTDALRNKLSAESAPVWPQFRQALAIDQSQAPLPHSVDDMFPNVRSLRDLSYYGLIDAERLASEGHFGSAFDRAFMIIEIGRRMEHSHGTLLHYLLGCAIASDGVQAMGRFAVSSHNSTLLIQSAAHLESYRTTPDGLVEALRSELNFFDMVIQLIQRDGIEKFTDGGLKAPKIVLTSNLLFKPNKTRRLYAEVVRKQITLVGKDVATIRANQRVVFLPQSGIGRYNPENVIGRLGLDISTPTWSLISLNYNRDQSRISATQALLAIRAYKLDHGALPESLDALVPDYLPSVPLDYMDFAPIRYSKKHRVVWSIGTSGEFDATKVEDLEDESSEIALRIP